MTKFLTLCLILATTVVSEGETVTPAPSADSGSGSKKGIEGSQKRLKGFGLDKILDEFVSTGDSKICGSTITEISMTVEDLKAQFEKMVEHYRRLLAGRCKRNGKDIKKLSESGGIEAVELAVVEGASKGSRGKDSGKFKGSLTDQGIDEVEKFLKPEDNTEEKIKEKTDKLEDITKTNEECVKTVFTIHAAVICNALSPEAETSIKELSVDNFQIELNTTDAQKFLTDCSAYIFSECQLLAAQDAYESLEGIAGDAEDTVRIAMKGACAAIAKSADCVESATDKCSVESAIEVAKVFLPCPGSSKGKSLGRSDEDRGEKAGKLGELKTKDGETGADKLKEIRDKGGKRGDGDVKTEVKPTAEKTARILIARILEDFTEGTATVSVAVSSSAPELIKLGESCGFDIAGLSANVSILVTALVGSLATMLA